MTIPVCLSSKLFLLCPLNQPQDSLNLQSEDVAELHAFSVGQRHIVQALGFAICVHTCLWRKILSIAQILVLVACYIYVCFLIEK